MALPEVNQHKTIFPGSGLGTRFCKLASFQYLKDGKLELDNVVTRPRLCKNARKVFNYHGILPNQHCKSQMILFGVAHKIK
jgi:hypothetical protein